MLSVPIQPSQTINQIVHQVCEDAGRETPDAGTYAHTQIAGSVAEHLGIDGDYNLGDRVSDVLDAAPARLLFSERDLEPVLAQDALDAPDRQTMNAMRVTGSKGRKVPDALPEEMGLDVSLLNSTSTRSLNFGEVSFSRDYFAGNDSVSVQNISLDEIKDLIRSAENSKTPSLRRNAKVLRQNGFEVLAGPHRGGLGSEAIAPDPRVHITVRSNQDGNTYHLRMDTHQRDEVESEHIFQITPSKDPAPTRGRVIEAELARDDDWGDHDALKDYLVEHYGGKVLQYSKRDGATFLTLLHVLKGKDGRVKSALQGDQALKAAVKQAARNAHMF